MSYIITITEKTSATQRQEGQWSVVDKVPWNESLFSKESEGFYRNQGVEFLKENPLKEVRNYLPAREVVVEETREILKQTVETLDLAAVIKAINKL